jgi:class 3 adenylate cyclase
LTLTTVHPLAIPDSGTATAVGRVPHERAVAFTDLESFTTYTESAGDDAAIRLMTRHYSDSETVVRCRGGRVIKHLGDGLMLIFPTAEAAVLGCLELVDVAPLPLRAGIHIGTVLLSGNDVIGRVVNLAARLTASARAGELVITHDVRTTVGDLRGVHFGDPQSRTFKGIEQPVRVYRASRCEVRF